MTDSASDSRDDYILQERMAGKTTRALARELHCTTHEINAALDRALPIIDVQARLRHIAIDLQRLEALLRVFVKRATEDRDVPSGMLCVKLLERKAALLGTDAPSRMDLQVTAIPVHKQSIDEIRLAIERVCNGSVNGGGPTGEGEPH
jgi:hypothetical protein